MSYDADILALNPARFWDMHTSSASPSTTLFDQSASGDNANMLNGAATAEAGLIQCDPPVALGWSNNRGNAHPATATTLDFASTSSWTYEIWFMRSSTPGVDWDMWSTYHNADPWIRLLLLGPDPPPPQSQGHVAGSTPGALQLYTRDLGGTTVLTVTTAASVCDGAGHMADVVWNGPSHTVSLYMDATLIGTITHTYGADLMGAAGSRVLTIGCSFIFGGVANSYGGRLEAFSIHPSALSSGQIALNYAARRCPKGGWAAVIG